METVEIKTRVPKAQVQEVLHDLPGILSSRKADRYGLRDVFYGCLAFEMYKRIGKAFESKSTGAQDELGNGWLPLAPVTMKRRQSLGKRYPLAFQNLIHRVSDKLFKTLQPGDFDGAIYHPRRNQVFHHARGKLTLGTKLDYSTYLHQKRPLWPEDISKWVEESLAIAIEAVIRRVKEVLQ